MLVIKIDDVLKDETVRDILCKSLVGTPAFINSEILIDDEGDIYIGNENDGDIQLTIRHFEIVKL